MIFVTGGTGMVGSHVLVQLSNMGKKIKALKRPESSMLAVQRVFKLYAADPEVQLAQIEWVEGNLVDPICFDDFLENIDEIYHCAATVSFNPSDQKQMLHTNITGTANLVNAALLIGNIRFCHVSSIAAIGRSENNAIINENTLWKTSKQNSKYSISKYGAEREVWRGIAEGLDAVIVNPAVILGPGNWRSGSSELFNLSWKGLKFYTDGITGFIDVRDVASCMILLMEQQHFGKRFLLSAENICYKDLFTWIAIGLGKKPPSIHIKPWMGEIAWRLYAVAGIFQNKKPAITRETARSSNSIKYYSSARVEQKTNFSFIPIKQSVEDICRIFLSEHI